MKKPLLTPKDTQILEALPGKLSEVARKVNRTPSNITPALTKMVNLGLVTRDSNLVWNKTNVTIPTNTTTPLNSTIPDPDPTPTLIPPYLKKYDFLFESYEQLDPPPNTEKVIEYLGERSNEEIFYNYLLGLYHLYMQHGD